MPFRLDQIGGMCCNKYEWSSLDLHLRFTFNQDIISSFVSFRMLRIAIAKRTDSQEMMKNNRVLNSSTKRTLNILGDESNLYSTI